MNAAVLATWIVAATALAEPPAPTAIHAESARRHEALIQDHFNLTQTIALGKTGQPVRLAIVFPDDGERTLRFWMKVEAGDAAFRLLAPDSQVVSAVSGREGEATVTADFRAGAYQLELDRAHARGGEALLGIRGHAIPECPLDPARVTEIPSSGKAGFEWGYLLYLPATVSSEHLLIAPNNTGFETTDPAVLRASASCQLHRDAALADQLGTPALIPMFPRPPRKDDAGPYLYLHALTRNALTTREPTDVRVDLQLLAMVKDARARLSARGVRAAGKLLLSGFSASGSFVHRFALLHPEEVLAVASGAPGGWPTVPLARWKDRPLPYPVGIADVATLTGHAVDPDALRAVRWFFFMGAQDDNDAVVYRDSFSEDDEALVNGLFGKTPAARWPSAVSLYASLRPNARFKLYPDTGHEVSSAMSSDAARFFREALAADRR